jgi:hypothetical protein
MARRRETIEDAVWYWNASSDPFAKNVEPKWTKYSDIENEIIEDAYQRKEKEVLLDNYIIDFNDMLQINKSDKNKQRPVKRIAVDIEQQCFIPQKPPTTSSTFNEGGEICRLVWEWAQQENNGRHLLRQEDAPRILRQQLDEEAQKHSNVEIVVEALEKNTDVDLDTLYKKCMWVYTIESFLYRLVNKTLRTNDISKLKTLGPFAFLLNNALWKYRLNSNMALRLYRGIQLKPELVEMYKASIGQVRSWPAFTSTSKNLDVAQHFLQNTESSSIPILFCITVIPRPFVPSLCTDLSPFSEFRSEAEVLLPTAVSFLVDSVRIVGKGIHEIRITI